MVGFDGTSSSAGTAEKWTFVSAVSECEPTATVTDPITSYTWNFGDGSPLVTNHSPTTGAGHAYDRPGTYTVTLTVTEQNCQSGPGAKCFTGDSTASITVENRPPIASFTAPDNVATGRPANFDASGSGDVDGTVVGYHWDFGDGHTQDATGPTTTHVFTTSGPKTVTLTVTDDSGATTQLQRAVSVTDRPPIASFIGPVNVGRGQTATFNASASSDPDGTITSYDWAFGDGSTQSTATPVTSHTYTQPGPETVLLTVVDDAGNSDHAQQTVNVTNGVPTASFRAPAAITAGRSTSFDASASADPGGVITTYRWDFGDGKSQSTATPTVSHTYRAPGAVIVTLTITDANGDTAAVRQPIKVLPRSCLVPRLLGRHLGGARRALKSAGCRLGAIKRQTAGAGRRGRVIRQSFRPGAIQPPGRAVTVVVGK